MTTTELQDALFTVNSKATNLRICESHTVWAVYYARKAGASWSQIGEQLQVSKQAAQQKYGRHMDTCAMYEAKGPAGPSTHSLLD